MELQESLLRHCQYIPNMPKLADLTRIQDFQVYDMLSAIPISIYHGFTVEEIKENCTVHEARRYLNELVILNEKNKSRLR